MRTLKQQDVMQFGIEHGMPEHACRIYHEALVMAGVIPNDWQAEMTAWYQERFMPNAKRLDDPDAPANA